jgi:hypothetical protein
VVIILVRVRKVEVMGGRGQTAGSATAVAGAVSGCEFSVAVVRFARIDKVSVTMALLLSLLNLRT